MSKLSTSVRVDERKGFFEEEAPHVLRSQGGGVQPRRGGRRYRGAEEGRGSVSKDPVSLRADGRKGVFEEEAPYGLRAQGDGVKPRSGGRRYRGAEGGRCSVSKVPMGCAGRRAKGCDQGGGPSPPAWSRRWSEAALGR